MKKLSIFISIFLLQIGFSQNIVTNGDFSSGLTGWETFFAGWLGVTAVVNADNNEANVTSIAGPSGDTWWLQLNQILTPGQIGQLTVGQSYKISFSARAASNRPLRLFFGENGGGFTALAVQDYTITTMMTNYEVTFTVGQTYGSMKLGFEGGNSNVSFFIDNVALELNNTPPPPPPPAGPTVAAPTPPLRNPADVLAFFSGAYTESPVTTWGADWGPEATPITDVVIAGNATKRINMVAGKTFAGIVLPTYNDLSTYTHFHIDYWIPNPILVGQVLGFKLSNHANQMNETSAIQTLPAPQGGQWVSVDVPLNNFTVAGGGSNLRNFIKEIVISAARANNGQSLDFYFDNLYFYKVPPVLTRIRQTQCGLIVPNRPTTRFNANVIPGATNYQFEVTINGGTPEVITTSNSFFNFSQLSAIPGLSSVIGLRVRAEVNGLYQPYGVSCNVFTATQITQLRFSQCGLTVPANEGSVVLNAIPVMNASNYEFEVIMNGGTPQYINTANSFMTFSQLAQLPQMDASITIRVRATVNTVVGAWGNACTVSTPTSMPSDEDFTLNNSNNQDIVTYPNPFNQAFNLRLMDLSLASINIFDINGRSVFNKQVENEIEMNLGQELNAGIYFLRVEQNGQVQNFKMIKK
jgi:endoglucanase